MVKEVIMTAMHLLKFSPVASQNRIPMEESLLAGKIFQVGTIIKTVQLNSCYKRLLTNFRHNERQLRQCGKPKKDLISLLHKTFKLRTRFVKSL